MSTFVTGKHSRDAQTNDETSKKQAMQTASQSFDYAAHNTEFRPDPQTSTRRQCKILREFGMPPSCHMVKTYQLIFVALSNIGYPMDESIYTLSHDIKELLYTSLSYGLSRTIFTNQQGSLENTIRVHFKDNTNIDEFIAKIKFLQEFNIIVREYPEGYLDIRLERVTDDIFDAVWEKMQTGKEYFILFSGNEERRMHAVHYFICGKSESEGSVKIYSAWGSDRVQNAFKSMTLDKEMFRTFVSSINAHEPCLDNVGLRDFLMNTMLRPENERYGQGTFATSRVADSDRSFQTAARNIEQDIQSICQGNLGLYRVPAYNDKGRSYLDTLTEVIRFGVKNGLFVHAPKLMAASSRSSASRTVDDAIIGYSIDSANSDDSYCSNDACNDLYAVEQDETHGGARKTQRSKITRRLRKNKKGKTMKRKCNIKRKKPKSTKLVRHHIVKK